MALSSEASAALVFLILYTTLFAPLLLGSLTGRLKFCSPYGGILFTILFHVVLRLASQATGLAFGIVGSANISLLVAYFILGAEGYFTLIYCMDYFLISWQYPSSASDLCLEPRFAPGTPWYKRLISSFAIVDSNHRPTAVGYILLSSAHGIIISGGTMVVRDNNTVQQFNRNPPAAQALRTAGQAILLIINIRLIYCIVDTIRKSRRKNPGKRTHPTLLLLFATCPLLFVRGLYGVMSGVLPAFNYFNPDNYGEMGFTSSFVISEYIMGPTMEWGSCTLLMLAYFTSLNNPKTVDLEVYSEGKKDQSGRAVEA